MKLTTIITAIVISLSAFAAGAEGPVTDYAVAIVNSQKITRSQVEDRRQQFATQSGLRGAAGPSFEQVLQLEINRALLHAAAKQYIDSDTQERIKKRAGEIAEKRRDPKVFDTKLESPKTTSLFNDDLLIQVYLQRRLYDRISISPAEVREYYDKNKGQFNQSASLITRQILVRSEGRTAEEAKVLIDKAAARLKAGEDFAKVAKEVSQDPYAEVGGLWPAQKRGDLIAQVEKAALALKPGEISEPVQSPLGWHIVRVEGSEGAKTFAMVQGTIYEQLMADAQKAAYERLIEKLRTEAIIKVMPDGGSPRSVGLSVGIDSTATAQAPPAAVKDATEKK
jgi:peptidyl-prolyl cis-trans isomerase C